MFSKRQAPKNLAVKDEEIEDLMIDATFNHNF
jgi:hypothetical protein